MGTTNGIEVCPDGKWLYVNESVQRNVWKFPIQSDGSLGDKQLIKQFPDFGFDGMRCDADGNLYITRHGKGTVVIMTPAGQELREIGIGFQAEQSLFRRARWQGSLRDRSRTYAFSYFSYGSTRIGLEAMGN